MAMIYLNSYYFFQGNKYARHSESSTYCCSFSNFYTVCLLVAYEEHTYLIVLYFSVIVFSYQHKLLNTSIPRFCKIFLNKEKLGVIFLTTSLLFKVTKKLSEALGSSLEQIWSKVFSLHWE